MIETLREFFANELNVDVPSIDTDLLEESLVDSLMLLQLIMFLESRYGFTVAPDSLEFDNFRSIRSIADFAATQMAMA
ncbi:acyl carrier protein [Telmatospirillum sp. J64-1]|uniref:acyl carrier protein n=1 Tax=Telmatospirillum sp. J64-1 TaxID=2502183 RepID=UPI00115D97CD|nr:acyl carrier protein [Telmatospirillum sp. J64-1]